MSDPILSLLVVLVVFLTVLTGVFLGMLIIVLVLLRKTLLRAQQAIDTVEDKAIQSLSPFLTLKSLFSNTDGFVDAFRTLVKVFKRKKSSR